MRGPVVTFGPRALLRLFNVIEDFNREALDIEIDFSLPSERVSRAWRGPKRCGVVTRRSL